MTLSLKEISEYIPNCLICGKQIPIIIDGLLKNKKGLHSFDRVNIRTEIKNNIVISMNKNYPLSINLDTAEILEGKELVNILMSRWLYIKKHCKTCHFIITMMYNSGNLKNVNNFPKYELYSEELAYTMPGGKRAYIHKRYFEKDSLLATYTQLYIDNKPILSCQFDFSKFENLKQINKRVLTIRTFQ